MKKAKIYRPNRPKTRQFSLKTRNSRSMGYDKDWDKYRFRFLHYNPQCFTCPSRATVVDHRIPHKGDMELFKDLQNHLPLCSQCHNYVTGKFDRKNPPDIEGKHIWIRDQRIKFKLTFPIKLLDCYSK